MSPVRAKDLEILHDEKVGGGGYLVIRRLRLRVVLSDGSRTSEGKWDYVERPSGLDAVVLALWRRRQGQIEVLLRSGTRVPVVLGRPEPRTRFLFPELVAGIVEPDDVIAKRAADEAMEEAGLAVSAASVETLGPPMFPTPGMCAELFHFVCCEVAPDAKATPPGGDGSPFEEGADLEWVGLEEAVDRCRRGEIQDMKTEIGLRRLREKVAP
jgi:ADP-ribose pyrophosphatase